MDNYENVDVNAGKSRQIPAAGDQKRYNPLKTAEELGESVPYIYVKTVHSDKELFDNDTLNKCLKKTKWYRRDRQAADE